MSTPEGELALRRRRRRKRPRRLLSVELPTAGDASANLYEEPSEGGSAMLLSLLSTEWMERPLPPMAVLAALPSTAAGRGGGAGGGGAAAIATGPECPPLLVDFLQSIGAGGGADGDARREDTLETSAAAGEGGNMANGTAPAATDAAREEEEGAGRDDGETADGVQKPAAAAAEEMEEGPGDAADAAAASATEVEPIDDPNNSTLTPGQHARYLHLWSSSSSSREFRSLDQTVRKEWAAYVAAVAEFQRRNVGRFLLGFQSREDNKGDGGASACDFVEAAAAARSVGGNNNSAKAYGAKCVQEISLQGVAAATEQSPNGGSKRRRKQNGGSTAGARAFDIKSYSARIVHSTPSDGVGRLRQDWAADQSSLSSIPLRPATSWRRKSARGASSTIQPIAQDDMAARLASEHGVDAVMTADTFVELLRRPGEADSRWMVPLSRANGDDCSLVLLEEPIPRRATTREYLTKAYEESVYESAGRIGPAEANNRQTMNPPSQSVYTVISLPGSSPQDAPCKVLVRSINTLLSDDIDHQRPIYLDVHLEYFHERGLVDQIPHHRRAIWLAHKLLQPDCRLLSVRVDPNTSRMISVSEKSVAHALAGSDESSMVAHAYRASADCGNLLHLTEFDASAQFEAMERVVRASTTCKFSGNLGGLLCLPGRGLSSATTNKAVTVSVHQEVEGDAGAAADSNTTADQDLIKIGTEIEEADAVFTGQAALMSCFVPWEWRDDPEITRIPFTFPVHAERS